jgi:cytochrome c553
MNSMRIYLLLSCAALMLIYSVTMFADTVQLISKPNTKKSHEFGTDCMSCHKKNGSAKAIFTVSGSVLDEARAKIYKNPVIKLYTERRGGGELVATILGDALGNFYSTEPIDFSVGLYPTLEGTPGVSEPIKHMMKPIFTGSCNSCHGPKAEKLGID